MKTSMALINVEEQKQQIGNIKKINGSRRLYVDFYYYSHRITKTSGLIDTPENRKVVQRFLESAFVKIENGTFRFTEAFPRASDKQKEFFSALEGREYNPEPNQVLIGNYLDSWKRQYCRHTILIPNAMTLLR